MKTYLINFDGRRKQSKGRYQNIQKIISAENLEEAKAKINIMYTVQGVNSTTDLSKVIILM